MAQYFYADRNRAVIADGRMARPGFRAFADRAQGGAVIHDRAVADGRFLADDNAGAMVDE